MPPPPPRDPRQRAKLALRIGRRSRMVASVTVTSAGLLSVGALVSTILLSTAVLVRAAAEAGSVRDGGRLQAAGEPRRRLPER